MIIKCQECGCQYFMWDETACTKAYLSLYACDSGHLVFKIPEDELVLDGDTVVQIKNARIYLRWETRNQTLDDLLNKNIKTLPLNRI